MARTLVPVVLALSLAVAGALTAAAGPREDQRLLAGARSRNLAMIEAALAAGAAVEAGDGIGRTALMWSAFQGHLDGLAYLIDNGALVDARDRSGRTALMWAALAGRVKAVERLIAGGADAAAQDADGRDAAGYAAAEGHAALARRLAEVASR